MMDLTSMFLGASGSSFPELPALVKVIDRIIRLNQNLAVLDIRARMANDNLLGGLPDSTEVGADQGGGAILARLNGLLDCCEEKVLSLKAELTRYEEAVGATTE